MPSLYGPRPSLKSQSSAENFVRHLTRELTAGGIPHWCEIRRAASNRFIPIVHQADCAGGDGCRCGSVT